MKNMFKMLGIIAIIAMIVSMGGCAADPEDQVEITINGIPDGANGQFAYIALGKKGELVAHADSSNRISGNTVSALMLNDKGEIFDKEGAYNLAVFIYSEVITNANLDNAYYFITPSAVSIVKGNNPFNATTDTNKPKTTAQLTMADVFGGSGGTSAEDKVATFVGNYKATYDSRQNNPVSINETIVLTADSFTISDDNGTTATTDDDRLVFTITEWDYAETPPTYSATYPNAFVFKGKITSSTAGYYGTTSQTGKGIVIGDIGTNTTTVCWMYLYFSNDNKVIRTPFSKDVASENKDVVLHYLTGGQAQNSSNGPLRVYNKQQP